MYLCKKIKFDMKRIVFYVFLLVLTIASCKSDDSETTDSAKVEVTTEMKDFTEKMTDTTENLQDIVKKFAESDELKKHDIINQNITEMKVVAKNGDCYTVETPDSGLTRVYEICWSDGKITSIIDKGIK